MWNNLPKEIGEASGVELLEVSPGSRAPGKTTCEVEMPIPVIPALP